MRVGVYKDRFFGGGGAEKQKWVPIWIALVWVVDPKNANKPVGTFK